MGGLKSGFFRQKVTKVTTFDQGNHLLPADVEEMEEAKC
jgi:hypothetical protein